MEETPTLLVVLRHSPWSGHWFAEGLDAALVGAVFGQKVQLLFLGQGALGLIKTQKSSSSTDPTKELALLNSLDMYGIKELMVQESDLSQLGLTLSNLLDGVHVIDSIQLRACFSKADYLLNF
ncbi:DsrE family protein [Vreelandella aquamarina]